jgi:hypothetical protein
MKQGDVFEWKYKNEAEYLEKHRYSGTAYWCKDQIAVCDDKGRLFDIYWATPKYSATGRFFKGFDSSSNCDFLDESRIELKHRFNFNNVTPCFENDVDRHETSYRIWRQGKAYFFIPNNSEPSVELTIKQHEKNIEEYQSKIKSIMNSIEYEQYCIQELEKGKYDSYK